MIRAAAYSAVLQQSCGVFDKIIMMLLSEKAANGISLDGVLMSLYMKILS